jgi:flagellar protein FliO/FliZ
MTGTEAQKLRFGRGTLNYIRVIAVALMVSSMGLLSAVAQQAPAVADAAAGAAEQPAAGLPAPDETELVLDDPPAENEAPAAPSSFWAIVRMLLVLLVAAAAIYGVVFLLRKIARPGAETDANLKVLAGAHLGSNRFVHVVSVGQKAWLVGATDGGVSLIAELDDKETVDALLLEDSQRMAAGGAGNRLDFRSLLQKLTGNARREARSGVPPSADNVRRRRQRIRDL